MMDVEEKEQYEGWTPVTNLMTLHLWERRNGRFLDGKGE